MFSSNLRNKVLECVKLSVTLYYPRLKKNQFWSSKLLTDKLRQIKTFQKKSDIDSNLKVLHLQELGERVL